MKSSSASKPPLESHPHLGHLFLIHVLATRMSNPKLSPAARWEAHDELARYRDEGRILGSKEEQMARRRATPVASDTTERVFSGQGIMFAVIDDREEMGATGTTTVDIIASAIESALDNGYEDSEQIARFLTTSAFQHIPDKRVRFNSVLKAGDVVGAQILRKLYNSYNELAQLADESEDPKEKAALRAEATGFAEALQIVLSPFSTEDPADPRLVVWEEVDRLTAAFEKEQRYVIRDRKGTPQ
jgi:hypothetical protein